MTGLERPKGKKAQLAYLKGHGVTHNDAGPVEKQPGGVLPCMVERVWSRERARAGGAAPCAEHPDEFTGDCPWCRGIWA